MRRQTVILAVLGSLGMALPAMGNANPGDRASPFTPAPRDILLLTDEATASPARGETTTRIVEACLHRLGLLTRHWSVRDGVPSDGLIKDTAGIVCLVQQSVAPDPQALLDALKRWTSPERPLVLLGGIDPLLVDPNGRSLPESAGNTLLETLGVTRGDNKAVTRLSWAEGHWPWFEIQQAKPENNWKGVTPIHPGCDTIAAIEAPETPPVAVAVLSPRGAYLADLGVLLRQNPVSFRYRWRFDPFLFFSKALARPVHPIPDVSTLNGRRVFFAHVDGDGFANVAIEPRGRSAAQVLYDELLTRTSIPTTVSIIARDLDRNSERQTLARRIFALPHIEAASHSYTHPHDWQRGIGTPVGTVADWQEALLKGQRQTLDPTHEIDHSLAAVQHLLPEGKRPAILLWSGMTNPPEAFLARTAHCGVANLNGGDAVVDPDAPSVSCVAPLADRIGQHWQIFSAAANENLFTNQWSGPYDGQLQLLKQFQLTETPRRLSAANLYYHFYAAERPTGLRALQAIYQWAKQTPLAYLSASEYARSVEGFIAARWRQQRPNVWELRDWGACRTARFDTTTEVVNLGLSEGVAGYRVGPGCLYVHLTASDATVVLEPAPPVMPRLEEASAPMVCWAREAGRLRATWEARGPLTVSLAGFRPAQPLQVTGSQTTRACADGQGRLRLRAPAGRVEWGVAW